MCGAPELRAMPPGRRHPVVPDRSSSLWHLQADVKSEAGVGKLSVFIVTLAASIGLCRVRIKFTVKVKHLWSFSLLCLALP